MELFTYSSSFMSLSSATHHITDILENNIEELKISFPFSVDVLPAATPSSSSHSCETLRVSIRKTTILVNRFTVVGDQWSIAKIRGCYGLWSTMVAICTICSKYLPVKEK
jgi:hypothetical protein